MVARNHLRLLLGLIAVSSTDSFSPNLIACHRTNILLGDDLGFVSSANPFASSGLVRGKRIQPSTIHMKTRKGVRLTFSNGTTMNEENVNEHGKMISRLYSFTGILSAVAWITIAYVALSFHPDPKFADCTMRHNLLTMGQAFAFPIPIGLATFEALHKSANCHTLNSAVSKRLNLGLSAASFWLAASLAFPTSFAFGYDLYSFPHKVAAAVVHAVTGIFALRMATMSTSIGQILRSLIDSLWNLGPKQGQSHENSSCYATGTVGLFYFTIQPIIANYPLATIPTILGKRLSRPASAFSLLGAIMAFSLKNKIQHNEENEREIRKTLRRGLKWGTVGHLLLIFLKIIGVDGGGLIFPGRGLWEVYPAMISVPFAAGVSLAVHAILCFASWTDMED